MPARRLAAISPLPDRVLRKRDVVQRTQLSSSTIDRAEAAGNFPQRVTLTGYTVGWIEAEVDAWLRERMASRASEPRAGGGRPARNPTLNRDRPEA